MKKNAMKNVIVMGLTICIISLIGCNKPETPTASEITEPATVVETSVESTTEPVVTENSTEQIATETETTEVPLDSTAKTSGNSCTASEADAIQYLMAQVPEIAAFNKMVVDYSKANNAPGNKPILRIDGKPNPSSVDVYEKNFFFIYIGEITEDHTNRWATFLVRQDMQEILVDDPVTGQYIGLDAWRRNN